MVGMSEPTRHDDPASETRAHVADTADAGPRRVDAWAAEPTGDVHVDEALTLLVHLDTTPVHEHAGGVERVHRVLQDRLTDGQD